MPKGIPLVTCKRCPKTREQAGGFTRSGYCIDCANAIRVENLISLKQHRGPYFERWYAACRAAFEFERIASPDAEA